MQAGMAFKGQGVFHNALHGYGSVQQLHDDSVRVLFHGGVHTVPLKELETAAVLAEHANPITGLKFNQTQQCWTAVREKAEEEVYA
jgi:hypothetical protein